MYRQALGLSKDLKTKAKYAARAWPTWSQSIVGMHLSGMRLSRAISLMGVPLTTCLPHGHVSHRSSKLEAAARARRQEKRAAQAKKAEQAAMKRMAEAHRKQK